MIWVSMIGHDSGAELCRRALSAAPSATAGSPACDADIGYRSLTGDARLAQDHVKVHDALRSSIFRIMLQATDFSLRRDRPLQRRIGDQFGGSPSRTTGLSST